MTPADRLAAVLALRVDLLDADACARITPAAANAYLAARGFQRVDTETWHVWTLAPAQVAVPRESTWTDVGSAMRHVVNLIAEHESRSPLAVWLDLVDADCCATLPGKTRPRPLDGQPALPGLEPPAKVRRTSQHRFGLLRWEVAPATPIVPEHQVALATCRHCGCQRRRANTGARLGAHDTYSMDGQVWSRVSPMCIPKGSRRA
jgi:hypothetical protein